MRTNNEYIAGCEKEMKDLHKILSLCGHSRIWRKIRDEIKNSIFTLADEIELHKQNGN